jgi:hypothetical protein
LVDFYQNDLLVDPPESSVVGVGVALGAELHVATRAELLAGALTALGCRRRTPILAKTPLPRVIITPPKISIEIITLDLPQFGTRITDPYILIVLCRQ